MIIKKNRQRSPKTSPERVRLVVELRPEELALLKIYCGQLYWTPGEMVRALVGLLVHIDYKSTAEDNRQSLLEALEEILKEYCAD